MSDFQDTDHDDPATHWQAIARQMQSVQAFIDAHEEHTPAGAPAAAPVDPAFVQHVDSMGRGMDELHTDLTAARKEIADLSKRVNTLARHMVGISKQVGYSFPQSGG